MSRGYHYDSDEEAERRKDSRFLKGQGATSSTTTQIGYQVLYASSSYKSKYSEDVTRDLHNDKGWISKKDCSYPQELIIGLECDANIVKILLYSHEKYVPKSIEFQISKENPQDPKSAMFHKLGFTEFLDGSMDKSEERKVFVDGNGILVRLKVQGNLKSPDNKYNQVGFRQIKFIGYKGSTQSRITRKTRSSSPNTVKELWDRSEREEQTETHETFPRPIYNLNDHPEARHPTKLQPRETGFKNCQRDPLLEIRTKMKLVEMQKQAAVMKGNIYEAKMSATAMECLAKAEEDLIEINQEKKKAQYYGDVELAERLSQKARDIRDECLATIHHDDIVPSLPPQQPIANHVSPPPRPHKCTHSQRHPPPQSAVPNKCECGHPHLRKSTPTSTNTKEGVRPRRSRHQEEERRKKSKSKGRWKKRDSSSSASSHSSPERSGRRRSKKNRHSSKDTHSHDDSDDSEKTRKGKDKKKKKGKPRRSRSSSSDSEEEKKKEKRSGKSKSRKKYSSESEDSSSDSDKKSKKKSSKSKRK